MKKFLLVFLSAGTLMSVLSYQAAAATATSTFNVTITVTASCIVSATNMAFPALPMPATAVTATSTYTVTCTNTTPYYVTLNNGQNFSATRQMKSAAGALIGYNFFTDAADTVAWTNATANNQTGTGVAQAFNLYGKIVVPSPVPAPGAYSDTVTITVNY